MFAPRRGKASINPGGSPQFQAQYIGHTETYRALGRGCTTPLVQRLWDGCPGEKHLPRVMLTLSAAGMAMKDLERSKVASVKFDIQRISYCSAESGVHDRVFAWICQINTDETSSERKLQCHAVLCSSREKAQTISLVLSRAFQIAYRDWKNEKEKRERLKATSDKRLQLSQCANQLKEQFSNGVDHTEPRPNPPETAATNARGNRDILLQDDSTRSTNDQNNKDRPFYEFNLEHKEMIESLNSISPQTTGDTEEAAYLQSAAVARMNIVEEDEISFTDNNLVSETVSERL